MKTLAIVVPCYNEEGTIHPFLEACQAVERQMAHQLVKKMIAIWVTLSRMKLSKIQ